MSQQDIAALLDFGLTSLQARVYVALLRAQGSPASRISSVIGIARPEAYRILHELFSKGIVQRSLGSPTTYTAVSPVKALSILLEPLNHKVAALSKERKTLTESLSSLHTENRDATNDRLSVISGGRNQVLRGNQMIAEAREDCVGILSRYGLRTLQADGTAAAIISARRRGVDVRLVTEIDTLNVKVANRLARYVEVRKNQGLLFYMIIVDEKEMVFGPAFPDPAGEEARTLDKRELDLWTSNHKFVASMYAIFEKVWSNSRTHVPTTNR